MRLSTTLFGQTFQFSSIKEVLAKANEEKSGDVLAGIAAASGLERIAAKEVLSNLLVSDLRENPVVPYEDDEVTRIIQDGVDPAVYQRIRGWTIAQLREHILSYDTTEEDIKTLSRGLTAEVIAGVCKLMSNLDLIYAANKVRITATCNTTIGERGCLSTRLQPNHSTDDVEGITASLLEGLSYGCGDALLGLNPVSDTASRLSEVLKRFDEVKKPLRDPHPDLRPGPHHHPDRGGEAGGPLRHDLPVHRRQPEGQQRLRLLRRHGAGGHGPSEGPGHRQGSRRHVL